MLLLGLSLFLFAASGKCAQTTNDSSTLTYGQTTQGIRGEIEVVSNAMSVLPKEIVVWVNKVEGRNTVADKALSRQIIDQRIGENDFDYFVPANAFCGPIELQDATGRILTLLKPEVDASTAYPASYSLKEQHSKRTCAR